MEITQHITQHIGFEARQEDGLVGTGGTSFEAEANLRQAIVIARSDKKNESISVKRFVLAGESPEEREFSATKVLTFALGVHRRALCSALPLFERASWADGLQ